MGGFVAKSSNIRTNPYRICGAYFLGIWMNIAFGMTDLISAAKL